MSNDKQDSQPNRARRQFLEQMTLAAGVAGVGSLVAQNAGSAEPAAPAAPTAAQTAAAAARGPNLVAAPPPLREVAGKVAFITGGSSGIGLGQARVFHEAGMKVVIGYIRDDQIGPALDAFKTGKDRVHAIKVNVIDRVAMAAAADEIEAKFGKIHLISNNAGIGLLTPLSGTEPKDFDQTVAINLTGVYNGVHIFLPRIRKHGEGGHIVTTSSMSGILPTEGGGAGAYTCTKFASVGMMEILRSELDTANANVGVSVYCPGLVNTNIFELAKNVNAAFAEPGAKAVPADAPVNEAYVRQIIGNGMDPMEAGRIVLAGIRNNDMWILSHPEFGPGLKERSEALLGSIPNTKAPPNRLAQEITTMHNSLYLREQKKLNARKGKA
jgi:NAD(P)-dependent dehydrogenase (short-subunit alcohol dehydrogenase family)